MHWTLIGLCEIFFTADIVHFLYIISIITITVKNVSYYDLAEGHDAVVIAEMLHAVQQHKH